MNKEILVIDDNPDIRFLICNILKENNFSVRSAANYDQAVLEINKKLPDLAIIDIKLDRLDKDGIDLLKIINKKNSSIPIIMISGHATVPTAVESIRLGAYEFIEKGASFSADKPELSPTARESGLYTANEAGPCWDGYKQLGMKKGKSGKPVPNCVKESQPNKFDSSTVLIFRRNPNTGEMKEMRIDKIKVNEYLSRGWARK